MLIIHEIKLLVCEINSDIKFKSQYSQTSTADLAFTFNLKPVQKTEEFRVSTANEVKKREVSNVSMMILI